jgi:hypothetical protein
MSSLQDPSLLTQRYSQIVLKGLYPHVATSHVLVIQWDGYVVNADLWDDDFLRYDYIGAPWPAGRLGTEDSRCGRLDCSRCFKMQASPSYPKPKMSRSAADIDIA